MRLTDNKTGGDIDLFFETENGKGSIFDQTNQITIKSTTLNTDRFVMFCNYLKNESALK